MIRTGIKGAIAHKARLALTALAIMLGVAFVSGTFIFTDTIQARFDSLFTDVYAGVDASVRAEQPEFGSDTTTELSTIPMSLLDDIRAVDDVEAAVGYIQAFGQVIDAEGNPVGGMGPPTYVYSWIETESLNPFRIKDGNGRPPTTGEMALDAATVELAGFELGDMIDVQFARGLQTFELVAIASFGDSDNLAGATIGVITLNDAQAVLGMNGQLSFIDAVAVEGVTQDALVTSIETVLPSGVEAVTGEHQTNEAIEGFTEGIAFLSVALLGFASVAVFVGGFIIYNTFRIIVAQRTRELALLRAIGASPRQVVWLVLIEALAVGLLASIVGIVAGVGLAELLKAGMDAIGFGPPEGPLTIATRTVVVGLAVGLVVTLVSALLPARQAARVPPVVAMQAMASRDQERSTRVWVRLVVLGIGVAIVVTGLAAGQVFLAVGGALVAMIGVLLVAPALTRPIAAVVGRPIPGVAGKLARDNVSRDPRRTSATASALTIGIALVVFTAIFAASTKDSISSTLDDAFPADLVVTSSNFYMPVSADAVAALEGIEGVETVSAVISGPARVDGVVTAVAAVDGATIGSVLDLGASIALADVGDGAIVPINLVESGEAFVGGMITIETPSGGVGDFAVVGTHGNTAVAGYVVDQARWIAIGGAKDISLALVGLSDGVALGDGKAAVEASLAGFPSLTINTTSEQIAVAEAQVDAFLVLFTGLLGLALIIAVLGIANTLALSIVERTHEIGLLRAVGMSRRQVRRMIRGESIVTALFGATVGTVVGLSLGWVIVTAFSDEGLSAFAIPAGEIVVWLVVAMLSGVVASALPARKASRLNILEALSYE